MTALAPGQPRTDLARAAAQAALAVLPASSPLSAGEPADGPPANLPAGQAVCARFTGAAQGEVAVLAGDELAEALRNSPLGELDLAKAVQPALSAAAGVFGPVVVDPGQAVEASAALAEMAGRGEMLFVPLTDGVAVQAAIALVLDRWPSGQPGREPDGAAGAVALGAGEASAPVHGGLDLLYDVEMEVSAELGRTRMSVRELLSLSPGAVVELDRAAGSPADLLVNGRLIARGEVVVIDENFGIRITEILAPGHERS
jgi:flagellar motor switch protein FliN/FliY